MKISLNNKESWSSYIRLLAYCKPYKTRLITALACMVVSSLFGIIPPWLIKYVVDDVLIAKKMAILNLLAVGMVVISVLKAGFSYAHR